MDVEAQTRIVASLAVDHGFYKEPGRASEVELGDGEVGAVNVGARACAAASLAADHGFYREPGRVVDARSSWMKSVHVDGRKSMSTHGVDARGRKARRWHSHPAGALVLSGRLFLHIVLSARSRTPVSSIGRVVWLFQDQARGLYRLRGSECVVRHPSPRGGHHCLLLRTVPTAWPQTPVSFIGRVVRLSRDQARGLYRLRGVNYAVHPSRRTQPLGEWRILSAGLLLDRSASRCRAGWPSIWKL
jgi:hypothetical protein